MSVAARLNRRITQLAVGRHLPHRTVRVRLTLLYGGLFLLSGAALMAITYALLVNAGFVFTLQNGTSTEPLSGPPAGVVTRVAARRLPGPGATTHPSAQTMAHWRQVAQCMRQHGVPGFPEPDDLGPVATSPPCRRGERSRRGDPRDPGHGQPAVAGVHAGGGHVRVHARPHQAIARGQPPAHAGTARAADPVRDRARGDVAAVARPGMADGRARPATARGLLPRRSASSSPTPPTSCARH